MKTHNNNIGKVIQDIGKITLESLDNLNIIYDEIIFGKPIADIYIDDRAINPYINDVSYFGIFNEKSDYIPNKINNNKYNTIKKIDNLIKKTGANIFMKGELYFYQNMPINIANYFPSLNNFNKKNDKLEIFIEYINGISLFYLYKYQLLTTKNIDSLFNILSEIHNTNNEILNLKEEITDQNIYNNYFIKLEKRFNKYDYFFENSQIIYDKIINMLKKYYNPKKVKVIHGDFWFSNILIDYDDKYKLLDMKGQVDNILTLSGDIYYDYGKFYQSILGYDLVLNNCNYNYNESNFESNNYYNMIHNYFISKCIKIGLDINYLKAVTFSLIFGTMHFIDKYDDKCRIWNFITNLVSDEKN
jgi:hypothetical protein